MPFTRTIALGIVLLLLAGYVYFFEVRGKGHDDEAGKDHPVLPVVEKDIESFWLSSQDQMVRCVRDANSVWWLTEPVRTEGSEGDITRLLSSLEQARVIRIVADSAAEPGDYGLDRPRLTIGVRQKKSLEEQTLFLGRSNPTGSYVYAKRGDRPEIFLVSAPLLHSLDKKLYDLRLKRALDFRTEDVRKISLRRGNRTVTCIRVHDVWRLEEPIASRADRHAVEKILQALSQAVASEFVAERPEDRAQYGFDRPAVVVDLEMGDGDTAKCLVIGKRTGDRYYAHDLSRPPVFTVDSTLVWSLSIKTDEVRDRSIMPVAFSMVRQIGWQTGEGSLLFRRDHSGTWEMVRPIQARADGSVLQALLDRLAHLSAEVFVSDSPADLRPYGLHNPGGRIEVHMEGDSAVFALSIGGNHGRQIYVQNSTAPSVYLVNGDFVDLLQHDPAHFRDRSILDFVTDRVQEIEVVYSAGIFRAARDGKGRWETPDGRDLAAGDMADFLSALHTLRAESFVDDEPVDLSLYGLDEPRFTVTLRFEEKVPEVLRIGGDGEQGLVYVAGGKSTLVCMVRSDVMEAVDRLITGKQTEI